ARLSPTGDFMLGLIANMFKESEGFRYEFFIYDNIDNKKLSAQRASTIERVLRSKRVKPKTFKVTVNNNRPGLPKTADHNLIKLEIIES
ncbi:MAG: hypothetical protein ACPGVV_13435, partial [Croceimicrobium sp.]